MNAPAENYASVAIQANNQPIALERILQVCRYRGFEVSEFSSKPSDKRLKIHLLVRPPLAELREKAPTFDGLKNQLNKIIEVEQVEVVASEILEEINELKVHPKIAAL